MKQAMRLFSARRGFIAASPPACAVDTDQQIVIGNGLGKKAHGPRVHRPRSDHLIGKNRESP
jgi:hypothetical protein